MKGWAALMTAVMLMLCVFSAGCAQQDVLLELDDGERVPYEPYSLYLDVAGEIARYSARQGIAFTMAMESYLQANHVILATDEFLSLCAEDMDAHMQSEAYVVCADILGAHYGIQEDDVAQCVWENYWSQYVARMLSGFFKAQEEMTGVLAEEMFRDFTEQFYENLSFDDGGVAVFAGESIAWTPVYERLCQYNDLNARLEVADTIAQNRSVEKYIQSRQIEVDLEKVDESLQQAVHTMQANEVYSRVFGDILTSKGRTMDEFLTAMKPFVTANFQRAAFGQYCYDAYQKLDDGAEKPTMEAYYGARLSEVSQPYTVEYLGW